ncbi:hypothetical protein MMC09_000342 [Bachmanniomyces sp. S44760]|nr:hypothetical protein [Bachmanniomyces sp. S44760]
MIFPRWVTLSDTAFSLLIEAGIVNDTLNKNWPLDYNSEGRAFTRPNHAAHGNLGLAPDNGVYAYGTQVLTRKLSIVTGYLTPLVKGSVTPSARGGNPKPSPAGTPTKRTPGTRTHAMLRKLSMLKAKGKKKDATPLGSEQDMQEVQLNEDQLKVNNVKTLHANIKTWRETFKASQQTEINAHNELIKSLDQFPATVKRIFTHGKNISDLLQGFANWLDQEHVSDNEGDIFSKRQAVQSSEFLDFVSDWVINKTHLTVDVHQFLKNTKEFQESELYRNYLQENTRTEPVIVPEKIAATKAGISLQSEFTEAVIPEPDETNPGPATLENVGSIKAVPSIAKPRTLVLPSSEIAGRQLFELRPASLPPRPEIQETEPTERQDSQNSEFAREPEDPQLFKLTPTSLPPKPEIQETEDSENLDSWNQEPAREPKDTVPSATEEPVQPEKTQQIITRVQ